MTKNHDKKAKLLQRHLKSKAFAKVFNPKKLNLNQNKVLKHFYHFNFYTEFCHKMPVKNLEDGQPQQIQKLYFLVSLYTLRPSRGVNVPQFPKNNRPYS